MSEFPSMKLNPFATNFVPGNVLHKTSINRPKQPTSSDASSDSEYKGPVSKQKAAFDTLKNDPAFIGNFIKFCKTVLRSSEYKSKNLRFNADPETKRIGKNTIRGHNYPVAFWLEYIQDNNPIDIVYEASKIVSENDADLTYSPNGDFYEWKHSENCRGQLSTRYCDMYDCYLNY